MLNSVAKSARDTGVAVDRKMLLTLRRCVAVAHHLPGRIRVMVKPGIAAVRALRQFADADIEAIRESFPGVKAVRMNVLAGSMVIEYDPGIMPQAVIEAFFRVPDDGEADALLGRLF